LYYTLVTDSAFLTDDSPCFSIPESMHAMSLRDADPEVIDELADCQYCGENVELRLLDNHEVRLELCSGSVL